MDSKTILGISFILFLIGLPLISFGSANDIALWHRVGLATVLVGAALPPMRQIGSLFSGTSAKEE